MSVVTAQEWSKYSLGTQIGHILSELDRASHWQNAQNDAYYRKSLTEAIALVQLSLQAHQDASVREFSILRDVLEDMSQGTGVYQVSFTDLIEWGMPFLRARASE